MDENTETNYIEICGKKYYFTINLDRIAELEKSTLLLVENIVNQVPDISCSVS